MDILIQSKETNLFLAAHGRWTARRKQALSFANTPAALAHCIKNRLKSVNLLFCYRNSALNFTIAPFCEQESIGSTASTAISNSVYVQAQHLELKAESQQLFKELDSIISEGKERRKRRAFPSSFQDRRRTPDPVTNSNRSLLDPQVRSEYRPVQNPVPSTNALPPS